MLVDHVDHAFGLVVIWSRKRLKREKVVEGNSYSRRQEGSEVLYAIGRIVSMADDFHQCKMFPTAL